MSASTSQPELQLSAARIKRPMVDRAGARAILDVEDWQLETATDRIDGVLNIASVKCERRELRYAVVCLEEYRRELIVPRTDAELAELIFGKMQPLIRAQRIYNRLNCHATHFYDLARERVIKLAKGSAQRSGPGGSAVVEWSALLDFIKKRRVA